MIQCLRICLAMQRNQVQSLAGELISHMPCGTVKNKNKTDWWIQQKRNRLTDIENKLVVTSGKREVGRGKFEAVD